MYLYFFLNFDWWIGGLYITSDMQSHCLGVHWWSDAAPNTLRWVACNSGWLHAEVELPTHPWKHIVCKCPPESGSTYYNYKKFFSVALMSLIDADYKFIWVDIGGRWCTSMEWVPINVYVCSIKMTCTCFSHVITFNSNYKVDYVLYQISIPGSSCNIPRRRQ